MAAWPSVVPVRMCISQSGHEIKVELTPSLPVGLAGNEYLNVFSRFYVLVSNIHQKFYQNNILDHFTAFINVPESINK